MKNILSKLFDSVPEENSRRFICPRCFGTNTFSVTKEGSQIKYQCFKNSCNLRGIVHSTPTLDYVRGKLNKILKKEEPFTIPEYWIKGIASKECLDVLSHTNSLKPYKLGYMNIYYDPKENRIVYGVRKDDKIVGAIGRSLTRGVFPKTKNYLNSESYPFLCGIGNRLVLVEDCASACAVSNLPHCTGMALLGTNLKSEYINILPKYKRIVVALDPDARKKGVEIYKKCKSYHENVEMCFINKDIKDMTQTELEEA